ncbi:SLC13 family permease [Pontibacillus litoralis]|uniref:Citrate:succinate antiporter n=1 Tax=Pontibacillus litoralis JSM 072002 TaxID=1385512 RepID=A0A0A5G2Q0_9BACI|nr:SLC13 family permease [Pontibacillus litoralis]KGX87366.1 hypothetical protein N784_15810 [Pontibacillus litoralis JSM 072002]
MARREKRHNSFLSMIEHFSTKSLAIVSAHVGYLLLVLLVEGLDYEARVALFAFLSSMTLWVTTKLPAGLVATSLIVFIVLMKGSSPELLYHSLSEEVVWLILGSFIIGEAVMQSGLADRLTAILVQKAKTKNKLVASVAFLLFFSSLFIPSTSGRAALSMPMIHQLNNRFTSKELSVLAIMAPTVILMSTSATLIGAGSHLIGVSLLEQTTGETISYVQWFIWGIPFAFVITFLTVVIIKWILWPKSPTTFNEEQEQGEKIVSGKLSNKEKKCVVLIAFLIIGWMTERVHSYDIAFITVIGALLMMVPRYGIIVWKQGVNAVSWNLILFVAAATALGKVLVDTGVVSWIEQEWMQFLFMFDHAPEWFIVCTILIVTTTSHLLITSHTTRAIVLIPMLLIFSQTMQVDPTTVVFLSLIGINYCVTFPVSSKALLLFYEEGNVSYDAKHLLKISAILLPVYIILTLLFYFTYWQWTGMNL